MKLRLCWPWLIAAAMACCDAATATSPASADPAHPALARGWVESRLYFALDRLDSPPALSREPQWRRFLDHEVTPRFPAGLSVQDVYGQWQGPDQPRPVRLRSKVLIIDYPDTADNRRRIEQIRSRWKQETGDRSVLRVTVPADVSF